MVISLFWCIFAVLFRFFQIILRFNLLPFSVVNSCYVWWMFLQWYVINFAFLVYFWCIFGVLFFAFSDYFRHRSASFASISLWLIPVIFGGYFSNGMSLILLFYYFKIQSYESLSECIFCI